MAGPTEGDDTLFGTSGDDVIDGLGGNDIINGRAGADRMSGGTGDDTFFVDDIGDRTIELQGQGIDLVKSAISWTLSGHVENLTLTGSAVRGNGNGLANIIAGNVGANRLDGRGGADMMRGGKGNDSYYVNDAGDRAVESNAANGVDTVLSTVSFTVGAYVENLKLTGNSAIDGTGNGLVNAITGNIANNVLDGRGGADMMRGGNGNDTYVVDNAGDRAIETSAGGGIDLVRSRIDFTLRSFVENLTLAGLSEIDGTGNSLNNVITGNAAANVLRGLDGNDFLDGGGGADTMIGGLGDDIFVANQARDSVVEAAGGGRDGIATALGVFTLPAEVELLIFTGADSFRGIGNGLINVIQGGNADDTLEGRGGGDVLFGGLGNDMLIGGAGGDHFYFFSALGADNIDTIDDFIPNADEFYLDRRVFTAFTVDGDISEAAFHSGAAAHDADDRIIYDPTTGDVMYDVDGIGGAAAIVFANVGAGMAITNTDFEALIPVL